MQIPFVGPTYRGRSNNIMMDRCINFYIELSPDEAKSPMALIGTPGTLLFKSAGSDPIRGAIPFNNLMYVVCGDQLYSFDSSGTQSSSLGTLSTRWGRVWMAHNGLASSGVGGNQLCIVDGVKIYIYNVSTGAFSSTTKAATSVTCEDGYFVFTLADSMITFSSALWDGTTLPALATASVLSYPDLLQGVVNVNHQLWFIKELSMEAWYNNSTATSLGFPFSRMSGGVVDYGTSAPWSIAVTADSFYFLANQRNGDSGELVGIARASGKTVTIISPPSINYFLSTLTSITDAFGYCYSEGGHSFYVLTFPTDKVTLVYDSTTNLWHERSTWDGTSLPSRHISNCYCFFNNKHYVGDWANGNIYQMSSAFFSDNGNPIVSTRITQHGFDREDCTTPIFVSRITVDAETGVGNSSDPEPQALLSWSDDGGYNFSKEYKASLGKLGERQTKLNWRRLGYTRDRVWNLTMPGIHKKVILGAYVEVGS